MMATSTGQALLRHIPSIGFSGAGFLACYHAGASHCLLQQGFLLEPGKRPTDDNPTPILTGVSGGALIAAAMSAGILPEVCLQATLDIARETRRLGGRLDCLRPGVSLVDQVEVIVSSQLKQALGGGGGASDDDYDKDLLLARVDNQRLRIGLTDRRMFSSAPSNPLHPKRADYYYYVDTFRDVEDIVAAAILSSYVPGLTGPLRGSSCSTNLAVHRAKERLHDMVELGFVKHGITGAVVSAVPLDDNKATGSSSSVQSERRDRERFWDGGLANLWPVVDENTVIVTPLGATFSQNPFISPATAMQEDDNITVWDRMVPRTIHVNSRTEIQFNTDTLQTLRRMALSSDETELQQRFAQGYDDARRFLNENNMLSVYTSSKSSLL